MGAQVDLDAITSHDTLRRRCAPGFERVRVDESRVEQARAHDVPTQLYDVLVTTEESRQLAVVWAGAHRARRVCVGGRV